MQRFKMKLLVAMIATLPITAFAGPHGQGANQRHHEQHANAHHGERSGQHARYEGRGRYEGHVRHEARGRYEGRHEGSSGVNQRQSTQKRQIQQGVRSGQLTPQEARGLRQEQKSIRKEERAYRSDGEFTRAERRDVREEARVRAGIHRLGWLLIVPAALSCAVIGGHLAHQRLADADRAFADAHEFRPVRGLHEMRRRLPHELHASVATRDFVPGIDDDAWLAVNNRAFADHGEQGGWTRDALRLRMDEPWFDPTGLRIHEVDGRLAAFCWTKLHLELDPVIGEIYVIAVDPDFHGRGLGKQLTLAGLDAITARGVEHANLYVDADNAVAVGLYRGLGFTIHRSRQAYAAHF